MPPAARLSDMHVCPMVTPGTPPVPHVGGPIMMGLPTVMIGFMPAARVGDMATCVGPPDAIAFGSPTVMIGGMMAARLGDMTVHGGSVTVGFPTVQIGSAYIPDLLAMANAVNPAGSVINCGFIVDAVIGRLYGTNPNATAPAGQDGTWAQIGARNGTNIQFGHTMRDAWNTVQAGGPGTTALVGIRYASGGAHIVTMTNVNGQVAVVEGQDWGAGNPREVITDVARAEQRYGAGSDIGIGVLPNQAPARP